MVFALLAMTYISLAIAEHQGGHDEGHDEGTAHEPGAPAPSGTPATSSSAPA
jgi:hypothetical protein